MITSFIDHLKRKFFLTDHEIQIQSNLISIKKWNWDYLIVHELQNDCVEFVLKNSQFIFFIFCSHPNVLTMGRGLQKINSDAGILLQEFEPKLIPQLSSKVEYIKRGGGLTFHYPGQIVFYPILNTIHHKIKIYDLMIDILNVTKKVLEERFEINGLNVRKDLLGLWLKDEFKLASIGLAANRFVTYHGMALNFFKFNDIDKDLNICFPCGLNGNIYKTIEEIKNISREDLNLVISSLEKKTYEIIERQRSSSAMIEATSELVNDLNLVEIDLKTESSLS